MTLISAYLAPLALALPAVLAGPPTQQESAGPHLAPDGVGDRFSDSAQASAPFNAIAEGQVPEINDQVRIEERVVIRIAPLRPAPRPDMPQNLPQRPPPRQLEERHFGKCIPIDQVVGVQPAGENKLILFLRNRRLLSATLERSCNARDYYSGFYVERTEDGNLCVDRDQLQSRAGSSCAVEGLHQLVAVRD